MARALRMSSFFQREPMPILQRTRMQQVRIACLQQRISGWSHMQMPRLTAHSTDCRERISLYCKINCLQFTGDITKALRCNSFVDGPNSAGSCYILYYHTLLWKTCSKCPSRESHSPSGYVVNIGLSVNCINISTCIFMLNMLPYQMQEEWKTKSGRHFASLTEK